MGLTHDERVRIYRHNNVKNTKIVFYPKDMDVWEYFQKQPHKNAYIRNLIKQDMERNKHEE